MNLHLPHGHKQAGDAVAEILRGAKTIAVVGLSSNPMRASNEVASYLKAVGYRIIPVNPNETDDIVDVFRRSEVLPGIADSAVKIGAKVLWMQLGIENSEAAEIGRKAGLVVVENACLLVEHKRRRR